MNHVLILANGDWGSEDSVVRLHDLASQADYVLAADGALDHALRQGIHVDTLIGDLDSVMDPGTLEERLPDLEVLRFSREKDETDLELAIEWALGQSPSLLTLFGASGHRLDHTLANLALLEKGLHAGVPMVAVCGCETVRMIQRTITLNDAAVGDRVSLLPVSLFATVSTRGLQYPLSGEKLFRATGRGVSNVVESLPVEISVESGVLTVVHAMGGGKAV